MFFWLWNILDLLASKNSTYILFLYVYTEHSLLKNKSILWKAFIVKNLKTNFFLLFCCCRSILSVNTIFILAKFFGEKCQVHT